MKKTNENTNEEKVSFFFLIDPEIRKQYKLVCYEKNISVSAATLACIKCIINNPLILDKMVSKSIKL